MTLAELPVRTASDAISAQHAFPYGDGPADAGLPPRDLRGVARRRWLPIVLSTAAVVAATAIFTARQSPVYVGAATVRIDSKRPQLPGQDILFLGSGSEVKTEMEMLRSRTLAEAVVDSLQLRFRLRPPAPPRDQIVGDIHVGRDAAAAGYLLERRPNGRFVVRRVPGREVVASGQEGTPLLVDGTRFTLLPGALRRGSVGIDILSSLDAVDSLHGVTKVTRRAREADIIEVRYRGTDPNLVRDIPNTMLARFIATRQDARRAETGGTAKFLRTQTVRIGQQLQAAEDSLRAFRERTGLVSIGEQAGASVRRLAQLQSDRAQLDIEHDALAKVLDRANRSAAFEPDNAAYRQLIAFPTLLRSQLAAGLLSSLSAADDRRAELLSRRRAEDPEVEALAGRIAEIEGQLHSIATTYLAGLSSQIESIDRELRQSAQQLGRIPEAEVRYARLDRQARMLDGIYTTLQSRLKEAELAEAVHDPSARIVDPAALPRKPVRPKPVLNLLLALIAGLCLGAGWAIAVEWADRAVHTRQDVRAATGLPVVGLIPRARAPRRWSMQQRASVRRLLPAQGAKRGDSAGPLLLRAGAVHSALAEAYRRLDTTLSFANPGVQISTLVVTSALPGEGKTTCAVNLAVTLARRGRRVALVDADLRRGRVASVLGLKRSPGLSDVLLGNADVTDAVATVALAHGDTLAVLPAGTIDPSTERLLASRSMREVLERLSSTHDVVVIDTPPVNLVSDAALLAAQSDGVILVARAGSTTGEALSFGMEQLRGVRAPVIGTLLNDVDVVRESRYDPAYRYYEHQLYAPAN